MRNIQRLDHVLCPRFGDGEHVVVGEDQQHYRLKHNDTGEERDFYKVHCHVTQGLAKENKARRAERANNIGKGKK